MLLRTSFCDILCYQILFALFQGKVIVFILFHQTSAHLYAKEKPQMSDSYLRLVSSSSQDTLLHIALCCLEGSTMSNLVHRRRRCARIVLHSILCLEGSTPQDRSGADTQAAPVGRCMCGIPYPGCRFALPWAKCLLPFQGAYFGSTPEDRYLHQAKDIVVAPGEPIFYCQRQLFCFLGA